MLFTVVFKFLQYYWLQQKFGRETIKDYRSFTSEAAAPFAIIHAELQMRQFMVLELIQPKAGIWYPHNADRTGRRSALICSYLWCNT